MNLIPSLKKCATCKEVKDSCEFTKNYEKIDCLKSNCKKCSREKDRAREIAKKKDIIIAY